MSKAKIIVCFALCGVCVLPAALASENEGRRPNIILIFTDDQGYQDLGCFGSPNIKTPNLDRMAAEGVRLTSFYAQPVCGVSRAALMTGCYPIRVAEPGNVKRLHTVPHPQETTMAEVLRKAGYATGIIGKWHLAVDRKDLPSGVGPATMPNAQGFDYFYGTPKYNGFTVLVDDTKMRSSVMRNQEIVVESVESWDHITSDYTREAINWIKVNRDKPFFLYLAHNMPHIPLGASEDFKGKSAAGFYGDTIEEIDWSCGEIFKVLKELGIDDNTLVVFTSDNGPWVETTRGMKPDGAVFIPRDHSGNADPLRGWKMSAWDGGSRVPFIARWPGEIPAGWQSDEILSTMDLLPTFAAIAEAELPLVALDGKDAGAFLTRKTKVSPRDQYLYYSGCLLTGVRSGAWKLVLPRDESPAGLGWWGRLVEEVPEMSLFNLNDDPGETTNVASSHPGIVAALMQRIERARQELGDIDKVGSGARFFDDGPRRLQVPVKPQDSMTAAPVKTPAMETSNPSTVDPAELYRNSIAEDKNLDAAWLESLTERGSALDRGIKGSKKDNTLKYIGMPVSARLKAYSPFIPLDLDNSTIPVTILRFTLTNDSNQSVSAKLVGRLASMSDVPNGGGQGTFVAGAKISTLSHACKMEVPPKRPLRPRSPKPEPVYHKGTMALLPDGGVPFRIYPGKGSGITIDGQCGIVLRSYREHLLSANSPFLESNWPSIKRAAKYLLDFDRNDSDFDGLLDGEQHNTLDAEWYGKVHALSSLYIATLRACEEMARRVGDTTFVELCHNTYEKGRQNIRTLFNGEYYVQLEDPGHPEAIGVGKGVYIDQVIGQFWANQLNLGPLYQQEDMRSALRSLWRYNFVPDVGAFRKVFREGRFYPKISKLLSRPLEAGVHSSS